MVIIMLNIKSCGKQNRVEMGQLECTPVYAKANNIRYNDVEVALN